MKEKYPYFFSNNDEYIAGSVENQVERIKDELKLSDIEVLRWIEGRPSSKYNTKEELTSYRNSLEKEINELEVWLNTGTI